MTEATTEGSLDQQSGRHSTQKNGTKTHQVRGQRATRFGLDDTVIIGDIQAEIVEEHVWIKTENEAIRSGPTI